MNKQFEEWYRDVFSKEHDIHEDAKSVEMMPWPFRWGVYLEYGLESKSVFVDVFQYDDGTFGYMLCEKIPEGMKQSPIKRFFETLQLAQESAVADILDYE
jgi:hypothetical protein